jgi:hypothetical protein
MSSRPGDSLVVADVLGDDYDTPQLQNDDLPPLYDDLDQAGQSSSTAPLLAAQPSIPAVRPPTCVSAAPFSEDPNSGVWYVLDSRLDADPEILGMHIQRWATIPPRPSVRIYGSHQHTYDNRGKQERRTVTDFDISVELTPWLFSDAANLDSWRELRTVENGERARRGTVLPTRAPGAVRGIVLGTDAKPTLAEWCHRYCASHAGLKCFVLRRTVVGFDQQRVREKLVTLVRAANYRGAVSVTFPMKSDRVEVYNDCRTNAWRLTPWIWWLCALTLMFILTWPYLLLRTKKFDVVVAEWPFSKPTADGSRAFVSISEDQWYNMWGRAIGRAVLERRQGALDQQDLVAADGPDFMPIPDFAAVGGAAGFLRASVNAMNAVNRQFGWGYDS